MSRLILVALILVTGCRARLTGDQGNLTFSYPTDGNLDFNRPIAVGARLDLRVVPKGQTDGATLVSATTDKPDVLSVVSFERETLVLEAKSAGSAEVQVEAEVSGETLPDNVDMRAAVPDSATLAHLCTTATTAAYFTETEAWLGFQLKSDGEAMIGYGYYPFTFTPANVTLRTGTRDAEFVPVTTGATAGAVTMTSEFGAASLTLQLVSPADIDDARLLGDQATNALEAGKKRFVIVHPHVNDLPVCQPKTQVAVTSKTPTVCAASAVQTGREDDKLGTSWGWVELDAQQAGTCTFEVSYPLAKGGAGFKKEFSLAVE